MKRWIFAAILIPVFAYQALSPEPQILPPLGHCLPQDLPGYRSDGIMYCQEEQCSMSYALSALEGAEKCPACGGELKGVSLAELRVLPADTRINKRLFISPMGVQFTVSMVLGGVSRASLHRPELCLPSQGFQMKVKKQLDVNGRPFNIVGFSGHGLSAAALAYTFFNQEGFRTSSHIDRIFRDVLDRSLHNRVDRWVMVTVNASRPGDLRGLDLTDEGDMGMMEEFMAVLEKELP